MTTATTQDRVLNLAEGALDLARIVLAGGVPLNVNVGSEGKPLGQILADNNMATDKANLVFVDEPTGRTYSNQDVVKPGVTLTGIRQSTNG